MSAAVAKSLQLCPTLSDPMDCSLPGSSIHGIFQARVLEWIAIAFSKARLLPTSLLHRRGLLGLPRERLYSTFMMDLLLCGTGLPERGGWERSVLR